MRTAVAAISIAFGLALPAGSGAAEDESHLGGFAGTWRGGGTARPNLHFPAWRVSCKLASARGANSVRLFGLCRLKLLPFISKKIDARLNHDPGSDSYSGTYCVDDGPPAILSGRVTGETLRLDMTWPHPVNGHLKSIIRIVNDGRGRFTLTTIDPLGLDGTPITTSDLAFTRE